MRSLYFLGLGLALILLQENLYRVLSYAHVPGLQPSLVLPIVVFMGVYEHDLARGAGIAFALGYATDVIGIAPVGLYTFTFVALFVLARAAGLRLAAQTVIMQIVLALGFTLLHSIMVLVLIAIFGRDPYVPRALLSLVIPHVLATAIVSPLVFRITQRVSARAMRGEGREARGKAL